MTRLAHCLLTTLLGVGVFVALLGSARADEGRKQDGENEKKVTLKQVPDSVRATIKKHAGKNKIKEIEEITKGHKKKIYEVEWIVGNKEIEILVAANGKLLGKEVENVCKKGKNGDRKDADDDDDEHHGKKADDDDDEDEHHGKKADDDDEEDEHHGKKADDDEDEDEEED